MPYRRSTRVIPSSDTSSFADTVKPAHRRHDPSEQEGLFNNAADASPAQVGIHAGWDSRHMQADVLDRGKGIRPEISGRRDRRVRRWTAFHVAAGLEKRYGRPDS